VLRQVWSLYQRYVRQNLSVTLEGGGIVDDDGRLIGNLDVIRLRDNKVFLRGWAKSENCHWDDGTERLHLKRRIWREDAPGQTDTPYGLGFEASKPGLTLDGALHLQHGDTTAIKPIARRKLLWQRNLAFALLSLKFIVLALWIAPAAIQFLITGNLAARKKVIARLGFRHVSQAGALNDAEILNPEPREYGPYPKSVTVIVPVFNAFDLLPKCLDRIVQNADLPIRLVIVEDCSTDTRIKPFLEDWIAQQPFNITALWNETNLGFVQSVNRAFEVALDFESPVVLINSDAMVPAGWSTRILDPMVDDPSVATVTPLSNNAEIFNVPVIVRADPLPDGTIDALDAFAATGTATPVEAPTGVGFCMAINHVFLAQNPSFDTAFGTGYGEEVDWCQKAVEQGGRNVVQSRLFVEHVGGSSFGNAEKQRKIAANGRIITGRYPSYDADVQAWITTDPILTTRLRMALKWADLVTDGPVPIYTAHSLGGGSEFYLQHKINQRLKTHAPTIVLRVGGMQRWRIEVHTAQGSTIGETDSTTVMQTLLAAVTHKTLIFSCAAGDTDPLRLPEIYTSLLGEEDDFEILLHNFYQVCPSYCLVGNAGQYRGIEPYINPAPKALRDMGFDLHDWQAAWRPALGRATRVVAFSQNTAELFGQVYPDTKPKLVVMPHDLPVVPQVTNVPNASRRVVAILGNLNQEKGAKVVQAIGGLLEKDPAFDMVILGEIDPKFVMPRTITKHGLYQRDDIGQLVGKYGITDFIIPSVWPETFSYTTHEALATGLRVTCFDLGAQADAVRQSPQGSVLPFGSTEEMAQASFVAFKNPLKA